ncbi:hypothetical protein [Pseudonocardia sp.]|uniref:hypothetical protein n=1 Tax=Pseudonocardia sp. TaxID=60912 RepID=UPI002638A887|nr:hypothetical protein [Pseudonocardia sp.]
MTHWPLHGSWLGMAHQGGGLSTEDVRLVLDAADLRRPAWTPRTDGVAPCPGLLGAA